MPDAPSQLLPGQSGGQPRYVGQRLKRREDLRFLTGRGRYVDDVKLWGVAYISFVRSPHAHADILSLSTEAAAAAPGVIRVLTAEDWYEAGHGPIPSSHTIPFSDGRPMNEAPRPVFATGKVCHVGTIVAAVVATTRNAALDAAELVDVEYGPLPTAVDTGTSLAPDAPVIHDAIGSNLANEITRGDRAAAEAAFSRAAHVTSLTFTNNRVAAMPMETLSYAAQHDPGTGETTLWATAQRPHNLRQVLCRDILHIPEHKLRVISPDVGGAFGAKGGIAPEVVAVTWAARLIGGTVRWMATRSEELQTETQGRDHATTARMAFDAQGVILAMEVDTIATLGAYVSPAAPSIPGNSYPQTITGLYRTPHLWMRVRSVYTNTVPVSAYRGSGRPEATFANERLLENGAREMGIDVVEMRRRNLIQPEQYPYKTPVGRVYDSGNPPVLLDKLCALSRYEALRAEQARLKKDGVLMGIGIAAFLDKSGTGPSRQLAAKGGKSGGYESALVRVHSDGKVTIYAGTHSHGQGHDITYSAIAADRLGIDVDDITVVEGDTGVVQFGIGTWGSRSISVGGPAVDRASERVLQKARRIAAHVLECDAAELEYQNQCFFTPRSNRRLSFAEVADIAYGGGRIPHDDEPGLESTVFYDPPDLNDPLAMHLVVVIIDPDTGIIRVRDYFTVDDCGVIVNPMIVEGQIQGGLAQGIGQALFEHVIYDPISGQLLTGSFMDYAMPRADNMPTLAMDFHETPAPTNPLGVKGGSETGTIGPPAAIGNAVVDALWDLGVRHVELPLTPEKIWRTIVDARMKTKVPA